MSKPSSRTESYPLVADFEDRAIPLSNSPAIQDQGATPPAAANQAATVVDRVLDHLAGFAKRPGMYVNPVSIATVKSYLHGLETACSIHGNAVSREGYAQVAATRGWEVRANGIVWHMQAKNLDDAAIIQELIAVEAEAFRRIAADNGKRVADGNGQQ
jgi:hypothetical protein